MYDNNMNLSPIISDTEQGNEHESINISNFNAEQEESRSFVIRLKPNILKNNNCTQT